MPWYNNSPKKIDDDVAKAAIELYRNSRTASEQNPRAHVFGAIMVGPFVEAASGFSADVPVYGVRLHRAIILRKRSNGDGGMADVEFEVLIGVGVDKSMRDVPGTYFNANKVEWK